MNQNSNSVGVWKFAVGICVVCSLSLAIVVEVLKGRRQTNEFLDERKHILAALRPAEMEGRPFSSKKLLELYRSLIQEMVVDGEGHSVRQQGTAGAHQFPVYVYHRDGRILAYAFPFEGKGLWSTIKGYIAVDADGETVRGLEFVRQEETAGLGAEIESLGFKKQFEGKTIFDTASRAFVPIDILRGRGLEELEETRRARAVDGITGATLTCDGVEAMLAACVKRYAPFLRRVKGL